MLDAFLEVAYEKEKQASLREEVVSELKKLPNEELKKIASGQVKLSFHDGGACWLDQFKGTPLYAEALSLEEKSLELDITDQQKRMAERQENEATWCARDAISVKKRMLELELRKAEAGSTGVEDDDDDDDDDEDEAKAAPVVAPAATKEAAVQELAAARGALIIETMRKEAAGWADVAGKAVDTASRLGGRVGSAALSPAALIGAGYGVSDAPEGRALEGALRGGAGALGGSTIGGGLGAAGGGLLGAGLGTAAGGLAGTLAGDPALGALLGGAAGGAGGLGLGGIYGAVRGGQKGYKLLTEGMKKGKKDKGESKKEAAMNPLRAAGYWEDPISDAASYHEGGKISPEAMQMMQEQARGDIADQITNQAESARYIKEHPIKGRLPGAALGGVFGAGMGALLGSNPMARGLGLSGKGALIGGGLGALAGAALTPGHGARMAEHARMQEASGALTDPALQMALSRSAGQQYESDKHQRKLERAQSHGENAALIQSMMGKESSAMIVSDAWGREMAKQAANEAAEAAFIKMAEVGFDNLEEMEKEAILSAIKAGLPVAKTFLGRAGNVLSKTYQGAGGGLAGVGEAAKKIPGLALQGGKKLVRGVKGLLPAAGAAAEQAVG